MYCFYNIFLYQIFAGDNKQFFGSFIDFVLLGFLRAFQQKFIEMSEMFNITDL